MCNFFFCHYVFKKLSAAEASESVYMRERVKFIYCKFSFLNNQYVFQFQFQLKTFRTKWLIPVNVIISNCIPLCLHIALNDGWRIKERLVHLVSCLRQIFVSLFDKGLWFIYVYFVLNQFSVPQGAPQHFSAVGLSENTVSLAWDLPAKELRNGEITMYELIYYELVDSINVEERNITGTQHEITNLNMNTDYIFQIKAYTEKGAGPWSNRLQYRTFGLRTSGLSLLAWTRPTTKNILFLERWKLTMFVLI